MHTCLGHASTGFKDLLSFFSFIRQVGVQEAVQKTKEKFALRAKSVTRALTVGRIDRLYGCFCFSAPARRV